MNNYLKQKYWSPYAVGAGIGLLSIITAFFLSRFLGVSSAFEQLGYFLNAFLFYGKTTVLINWKTTFVISIFFGSFVASKLSGTKQTSLPSIWSKTFGKSKQKRYIAAFFGGILVLFGARIAGGCTSGHAISGTMQLAISSWYFLLVLFASGMITAFVMYKR